MRSIDAILQHSTQFAAPFYVDNCPPRLLLTFHSCFLNVSFQMGLGKTLQGITLLWTLLNNGHEELGGMPMARRVIICCPTSLVSNWDSECTKWLNVSSNSHCITFSSAF